MMRTDGSLVTTSSLRELAVSDVGAVRFDGAVLDQQHAEMIAESIPHIVWTASRDGATTYFNRQGTDYTGHPRETNYEWNWVTLVHPEDAERAGQAWQHATMTGTEYLRRIGFAASTGSSDGIPSAPYPLGGFLVGTRVGLGEILVRSPRLRPATGSGRVRLRRPRRSS